MSYGGPGSQARSTGGSVPPRPTPRASPQANSMLRLDQKTFQFLNNAWVSLKPSLSVPYFNLLMLDIVGHSQEPQ